MLVRAIDSNGDWEFGASLNNYKSGNNAIAQIIQTRLNSFLGDCFFDQGAGINWFGFLGSKNPLGLQLAISSVILNTVGVVSLTQLFVQLNAQRQLSISYSVQTTSSTASSVVQVTI